MPAASTRGAENAAAFLQIKANQLITHAENRYWLTCKMSLPDSNRPMPISECRGCMPPLNIAPQKAARPRFSCRNPPAYSQRTSFFGVCHIRIAGMSGMTAGSVPAHQRAIRLSMTELRATRKPMLLFVLDGLLLLRFEAAPKIRPLIG